MGLMICIIFLFFAEVSIVCVNATQHENEFTPYTDKKHAVTFLKRHKRSVREECNEGCYLEEMFETFHNTERSHEYMTSYKCGKMSCSQGCTNTNHNFGHIKHLHVACKVNGGWTSWYSWRECLVTSTGHGQQTRYRSCTNPSPYNGGSYCRGSSYDSRACAINGGWTSWSSWRECLVTSSGGGQQRRYRSCTNPSPYNGGSYCRGSSYDSRACEKTCSWLDRWCWPGRCSTGYAPSCNCMEGFKPFKNFSTAICQLTSTPSIGSCQTRVFGRNGSGEVWSNKGSPECSLQHNMYGRFQVNYFIAVLMADFTISIKEPYKSNRSNFVTGELFGVTDVDIRFRKVSISGEENTVQEKNIQLHQPAPTFSNDKVIVKNSEKLTNGEQLCLIYTVYGGGFLVSKDLQSPTHVTRNVPYDKTKTSKQICYTYDRVAPEHCSQKRTCKLEPMTLSKTLTSSRGITLNIDGWFDPYPTNGHQSLASGIEMVEIHIYEVTQSTPTSLMRDTKTMGNYTLEPNATEIGITLPDKNPMLYSIFLEVKDRANNVRQARRFVLFDKSSTVVRNGIKPFRVTSASTQSKFKWQVNNKKLCFSWKDRFYNKESRNNNLLRPLKLEDRIQGQYDQIVGPLPVNGTQNVNGLTEFNYFLKKNNNTAVLNGKVPNFMSESVCLTTHIKDGDIFTIEIQAKDIMNHTLNDSVSVNIDTSVPEITDIWLVRDGQEQIYVHHSSDLSLMTIKFKSFDIHSGLREVKWAFGVYENKTVLIEKAVGITAINTMDGCVNNTDCYCPIIGNCTRTTYVADLTKLKTIDKHTGNHNRRYFFTIKVINAAHLVAIEHIDILVDESPPEVGMVLEGPMGSPDIDYTCYDDITVHWHDFIDHESGIKFYRIALGRECIYDLKDLTPGQYNDSIVQESSHKSLKTVFPDGVGQYFVTVIAYNYAMSSSKPVCSDGVTLDKSIPNVNNVRIKNAKTVQSIGCHDNKSWLIKEDASKIKLIGDKCFHICENEPNDEILSVLPQQKENKSENADVSSFLCNMLERYTNNIIYTPSDLFEVSWDITEDHSQIANIYIGFGRDVTSISSPDLMSYVKVHDPTKYIQRHPGLIGEERVYAFIKVQNRASLERNIWFGPILADETPPICASSIGSVIEGDNLVVKWTYAIFFDAEQKEEIGKIMFRIGFDDKFITPYLEWNIKSHGGQCGSGHQCIKYPIHRLQKYDSMLGAMFFVQLHVYNYAGHFCSVNSRPIRLPSLFPPQEGVVMDVYPDSLPPYLDTDITFNTTVYCFAWRGFGHHENVQLMAGLGARRKSDDVVNFHNINEVGYVCEKYNGTKYTKYFVTIKASCSGGTTYVSSNGFTVLKKKDISSSLKVFHGNICNNKNYIQMTKSNTEEKLHLSQRLTPGSTYSLTSPSNASESCTMINSNIYIKKSHFVTTKTMVTFIPLDSISQLNLKLNNNEFNSTFNFDIELCKYDPEMAVQSSDSLIPIHWSVPDKYAEYISHYETGLCKMSSSDKSSCNDDMIFILCGNETAKNFQGHFNDGFYKAAVRPCFGHTCLEPVWSKGITLKNTMTSPIITEATGTTQLSCFNTNISLNRFQCTSGADRTFAVGYRWSLFSDRRGQNMISDWRILTNTTQSSTVQDSECFKLPVYSHKKLYACVNAFCLFGPSHLTCLSINMTNDPNKYNKDILYDLNLNDPLAKSIQQYQYSLNIGDNLGRLHDLEMDFTDRRVRVGGFLLCHTNVLIEWYLMKVQTIPHGRCSLDPSCLTVKTTSSGFVDFDNPRLTEGGLFYLCAILHQTDIHNVQTKHICSDGFLVDESSPMKGVVTIESTNGYIIEASEITIHWSGFQGNPEAVVLGYPSDIAVYQYAIGKHPGSDDVLPFTTSGLFQSKAIRHLDLKRGQAYYATVRAFNHLNKSVEGYSDVVIYDNTPPLKGRIQVTSSGLNSFVTTQHLSIEWSDIQDDESGLDKIEIGLGSSNRSADIIPFREFVDYAEINENDCFQDGHKYFAILKATNRAGLTSYTVSGSFVIDSSPPKIGHVMDVLPSLNPTKQDIDYQTETNSISCSWYGFHDSHSYIARYKVGLGTSPGDDDIAPFTDVGLQTYKTWNSSFHQGVKYFSTVISCNGAGLCSRSTSNGVIIDNSGPIPGLVVVGGPGRHTRYLSHTKSLHASWIGFEDPHTEIDGFQACVGTSLDGCNVMERWNVSLSSSFIRSNLNMTVGVHMFVTVRACNKVNICTQRSSPSFIIDDTPPSLVTKPYIKCLHQDISARRQIISDPSFFKVSWEFKDDESPIIRTSITIYSKLDSHVPIQEMILSNENQVVIHLSKSDILRQGDVYKVRVTACNAASLCKTALSDEILIDYTPPQLGGFMPPLQYEMQNGGLNQLILNLTWYGFVDSESDIRSYYVTVGYTYSGSELIDSYQIVPNTTSANNAQQSQVSVNVPKPLPDTLVLTIWAQNNAGLNTTGAKVTTTVLSTNKVRLKGDLIIQKHSCKSDFCNNDCTCAVIGKQCKVVGNISCTNITGHSKGGVIVNLTLNTGNKIKKMIGSSKCLGSDWFYSNHDSKVLRFEYSFGIHGEKVGQGVFNLSIENPWHDVGQRTHGFYCLSKECQLQHNTHYVAYVRAWVSFTEYVIFESPAVIVDHSPPDIHKKHFVIDSGPSCDEDVDYLVSGKSIFACWDGVFSDDESGIAKFMVSLGTSPSVDDVMQVQDVGMTTRIDWTGQSFEPGTRYYTTVRAVNSIGLQTEVSSDGFVLDDSPPVVGVVYNTGHHNDVIYQSAFSPVQFSWHGFDDEHSFIDSYSIAYVVNDEKPLENESMVFTDIELSNSVLYTGHIEHKHKIIALLKAKDKAGHESSTVTSRTLYIDSTPPESFVCTKLVPVEHQEITDIANDEFVWSQTIPSQLHDILKIEVVVRDIRLGFRAYLTIDDLFMVLPFSVNADGSVISEYTYLSQEQRTRNISVHVYDIKPHTKMVANISKCSKLTIVTNGTGEIMAQQISHNTVSICVPAIDLESGIKLISTGIGSVLDGLEIQSLRSMSSSLHDVIQGNFTHGMQIFIKAEIENHAGLKSVLRSNVLIIDHTAPVIQNIKGLIKYLLTENQTMVTVMSTWKLLDEESKIKYCHYCIGVSNTSSNVIYWTRTTSFTELESPTFRVGHGSRVYGTVRCINAVDITGYAYFGPLVVAYLPPQSVDSNIEFITDTGVNHVSQSDSNSLTLRWNEFKDLSQLQTYCVQVSYGDSVSQSWQEIGYNNYLKISHLSMVNGGSYGVTIRGVNIGGIESDPINNSMTVDSIKPKVTDIPISIRQLLDNEFVISWTNLFTSVSTIESYDVSIGSLEGNTDILMPTSTPRDNIIIYIPDNVKKLYCVVIATSQSGLSEIYKQNLIMG